MRHLQVKLRSNEVRRTRSRGISKRRQANLWLHSIEGLEQRLVLATVNWTGLAGDFLWSNPANWDTNSVPSAAENVAIHNVANGGTIQINGGGFTVNSLTTDATGNLNVSDGTLTTTTSSQINGNLTLSGGDIEAPGGLTLAGSQSAWSSGTFGGSVINIGSLTISGSSDKYLTGKLTNSGTTTFVSGSSAIIAPSSETDTVVNQIGGLIDVQSDGGIASSYLPGLTLVNAGTLRKSAGTGTSSLGLYFVNNNGTVQVQSGALWLSGDYPGTTLTGGTYLVQGTGVLQIYGLDVHTNAATIVLDGPSAKITDPSRSDVNALANLDTNASTGSLTLRNGTDLTVAGSLANSGALTVGAGSTLTATSYSQGANGSLSFELGGTPASGLFGQIATSGAASLDGTLNVAVTNGFQPQRGQSFPVMSFASHSGTFATINGLNYSAWIQFQANLSSNALTIDTLGTTPVDVQSNQNPSTYGDSLTFTATIDQDPSQAVPTGSVQFLIDGAPYGPAVTVINGVATLSGITHLGAGSHTIRADYSGDSTYAADDGSMNQVVGRATLTITADDKSMVYGHHIPNLTASYSGFVNGEGPNSLAIPAFLMTSANDSSPVGNYPIAAYGASSPNYTIQYADGTLSITPAALTIAADFKSKVYGQANPTLTATYIGFVNGDDQNDLTSPAVLSTTATVASPVGDYPITVSGATSPNYTIQFIDNTLRVTPASLTIRADDKTRPHGQANPALTATYIGFVNGDDQNDLTNPAVLSTTATVASPIGTYPITVSGATSPNYTITFESGTLTITQGTTVLVVMAEDKSKVYGQPNPFLTVTYIGFLPGDGPGSLDGTLHLTTSATAASPVGQYSIIPSGLSSQTYTIHFVSGTLSVTPAALTITADDKSKVYGQANPPLTASYSGFVNGDDANDLTNPAVLSTAATAASPVGTYPITVSGATASNYTITFVSGTLNVTPAALTITADDKSKVYGQANPPLTASYSGFVNGDDENDLTAPAVLSTAATAASPVGTYPITVSGATASNYAITFVSGTLSVGKAQLTVTADDKVRDRNQANPPLTYTLSGFVNGDGSAVVSGSASLSTTATLASPAGAYPITPTLGNLSATNYEISVFVPGTLSVLPIVTDVRVGWGAQSASIISLNGRLTLPWSNIKTIDVSFSDNVVVDSSALVLRDSLGNPLAISGFTYDPVTFKATWSLPVSLGIDRFSMLVDSAGVHLPSPSTGIHMNNYNLGFAVLPGDFTGDGVVNAADLVGIRNQILAIGDPQLAIWADLDGDGDVDMTDYNTARGRIGNTLPPL